MIEAERIMKIVKSSGNVFADLGFDQHEATVLHFRSSLMVEIAREIESRSLSQSQAARLLGVTQPRISDLKRGKIDLFSIDMLITMALHLGLEVDISVTGRSIAAPKEVVSVFVSWAMKGAGKTVTSDEDSWVDSYLYGRAGFAAPGASSETPYTITKQQVAYYGKGN